VIKHCINPSQRTSQHSIPLTPFGKRNFLILRQEKSFECASISVALQSGSRRRRKSSGNVENGKRRENVGQLGWWVDNAARTLRFAQLSPFFGCQRKTPWEKKIFRKIHRQI